MGGPKVGSFRNLGEEAQERPPREVIDGGREAFLFPFLI